MATGRRHLHRPGGGAVIALTAARVKRPALAGEALVVLVLVFAYDRIREFAAARADLAISNGRHLLSAESWMHVDVEPALNHALSHHADLELLSSWYYQLMHLSVTLVVLLWVYWRHPIGYPSARNALVGINAVALIVFWVFPVAPPRLIPGAGFIDSTVVTHVAEKATTVSPDLYAAMPSLHIAWATWVALQVVLLSSNRWARGLALAHAVVTSLAVMATANHYLLDIAAGCVLAVAVVRWSRRRLSIDVPSPRDGAAGGEQPPVDRVDAARPGLKSARRPVETLKSCAAPVRARIRRAANRGDVREACADLVGRHDGHPVDAVRRSRTDPR
jgi:PAP2 superfamily